MTCRVVNRNKYIEENLCITFVIHQESLHDAQSTKCKKIVHMSVCLSACMSMTPTGWISVNFYIGESDENLPRNPSLVKIRQKC